MGTIGPQWRFFSLTLVVKFIIVTLINLVLKYIGYFTKKRLLQLYARVTPADSSVSYSKLQPSATSCSYRMFVMVSQLVYIPTINTPTFALAVWYSYL